MDKVEVQRIFNRRAWELGRDKFDMAQDGNDRGYALIRQRYEELEGLAFRIDLKVEMIDKFYEDGYWRYPYAG